MQQQQSQMDESTVPLSSPNDTGIAPGLGPLPKGKAEGGAAIASSGAAAVDHNAALQILAAQKSLYETRLFRQPSASVEAVLAASCEVMGFDISEMWLRTGIKTHQLTNSHLRPTALEDSVRNDLVDVYYGDKSAERTHRLSPALCKRAKEANDVVWVTAHTPHGAEALRCSISNVRTAVAVPVCHEASNTNITIIFFSIRRIVVRPTAVEFLVHMSLAAGGASVNSLAEDGLIDREALSRKDDNEKIVKSMSRSEHVPRKEDIAIRHQRVERYSITGAPLDLQWRQLHNVEYLTDGGNSWIHTAVFQGKPVVVKTLKPECQDVVLAINEIEGELAVHSRLYHTNIVALIGAGTTSKGVRFVVLERLDGGTLTQMLGYDTRIRDRRRRFWRRKQFSYVDVLRVARSIADAMSYCHQEAIPGCMVLHRDLKPDNIGFTLDGTVKIIDFGLAKIVENASVDSDDIYTMSGETGSLRYMAPEVADALPYNAAADVYSFGIILWEMNATKKPFEGLNRELFYERVVHGGERPSLNRKWPSQLTSLLSECWDADMHNRPRFKEIVGRLDALLAKEKGGPASAKKKLLPKITGMIDRHSTWF
jgi:serine/threonine protein kinase